MLDTNTIIFIMGYLILTLRMIIIEKSIKRVEEKCENND